MEKVEVGTRLGVDKALLAQAIAAGVSVEPAGGIPRAYLSRREEGVYPTSEEFYVAAPALADDKHKPSFEGNWGRFSLTLAAA